MKLKFKLSITKDAIVDLEEHGYKKDTKWENIPKNEQNDIKEMLLREAKVKCDFDKVCN